MKQKKKICVLLLVVCICVICSTAFAAIKPNWPNRLRFMAGPPGGNWFALGTALANVWSNSTDPKVPQTTSTTGGGVSNTINVSAGKAEFSLGMVSLLSQAVQGVADFEGKKINNVSMLTNLYSQYVYFVMRKDYADKHGVKSVGDIIEKKLPLRFATLKPGTASESSTNAVFRDGYGIDYKKKFKEWNATVEYGSYEGGADLLVDNHIDCFAFISSKMSSVVMNIESKLDVVLLEIEQEAIDKTAKAYGTVTFTVEPGFYRSVTKKFNTVGDYACIIVRNDLPEDLVYALTEVVWKRKTNLVSAMSDVKELEPSMALPSNVPAHPGSVKFWSKFKK